MTTDNLLHASFFENPEEIPPNRKRGLSTGLALHYISAAILNPNTDIVLRDDPDTYVQNKRLQMRCKRYIKKLQLIGFAEGYHPTRGEHTLRCDLIIDNKEA